ncbi:MAG: glycosyltransferase family 4 protein [Acidimicrobiia bacterium]
MKVLIGTAGYGTIRSGADRMVGDLARFLAARGNRVLVACRNGTVLHLDLEATAVEWVEGTAVDCAEAGLAWQPDVWHLLDLAHARFLDAMLEVGRSLVVPVVVTPASDPAVWDDENAACRVLGRADRVLALTRAEAAAVSQLCQPASEPQIISQAVALTGTGDAAAFRRRHGLSGPIVLFVGRKIESKGYQVMLAAASRLAETRPDVTVCLLGSRAGEGRGARSGNVLDLDDVTESEKNDAFAAAALFCLPSVADVYPLTVVEARLSGVPIVVGPFPGAEEVVRHQVDGLIVPANHEAVAAAVDSLLADPAAARAMAAAGLARAREEHAPERVGREVLAAYQELGGRARESAEP